MAGEMTLSERVEEVTIGPIRVLLLPTTVRSVVTWRGSFCSLPDFAAGDELLQMLTVALLDKGTHRRDRFAIAEVLDGCGAQLQFASDALRIALSGRSLREDVPTVLRLMAEQLREPRFDPDEFEKARANVAAQLRRSLDSTGVRATSALTRRLYPKAHPNYQFDAATELARLQTLTVAQVQAYHARHFGANGALLVLVGDVEAGAILAALTEAFAGWLPHEQPIRYAEAAAPMAPGTTRLPMADKQNLDVRLGQPVALRRDHPDFLPLYVGTYIFGGNFSARLMDIIRDRMGLTYGIHAALSGIAVEHDGHWQVSATFSQSDLEKGLAATQAEVLRLVEAGVTAAELAEKQTTLTGLFQVQLATTGGLAATLLTNAERGFDVGYLDQYPDELRSISLAQVNAALQRYLQPEALHCTVAGTMADPADEAA
jgi:predicted Zn-dependent peptidase